MTSKRPTEAEKKFLNLAYHRFYDIFDEVMEEGFWEKDAYYRFCTVKDAFTVYRELLKYEPIKWVIDWMKKGGRPQPEGQLAYDFFKFIRNIFAHFPFFITWNSVSLDKGLINWKRKGQFIDHFLESNEGEEEIKYRFWEEDKKKMTYLSISFPENYSKGDKVSLKNIISEKEGVKFSLILMKRILDTQVIEWEEE